MPWSRHTVCELNDSARVRTFIERNDDFVEGNPDFIDVAAAVNNNFSTQQQITWLLDHQVVDENEIQALLDDANAVATRAREFLDNPLKNIDLPSDALATDFAVRFLLEENICDWFMEKASEYSSIRAMPQHPHSELNVVKKHAKRRAQEINNRGPQGQVEWLFRNGLSEHDLVVCLSGTPRGSEAERQKLTLEEVKARYVEKTPEP